MSETTDDELRTHNEAPAEGDEQPNPDDIRVHAEDPAEGPDEDAKDGGGA